MKREKRDQPEQKERPAPENRGEEAAVRRDKNSNSASQKGGGEEGVEKPSQEEIVKSFKLEEPAGAEGRTGDQEVAERLEAIHQEMKAMTENLKALIFDFRTFLSEVDNPFRDIVTEPLEARKTQAKPAQPEQAEEEGEEVEVAPPPEPVKAPSPTLEAPEEEQEPPSPPSVEPVLEGPDRFEVEVETLLRLWLELSRAYPQLGRRNTQLFLDMAAKMKWLPPHLYRIASSLLGLFEEGEPEGNEELVKRVRQELEEVAGKTCM